VFEFQRNHVHDVTRFHVSDDAVTIEFDWIGMNFDRFDGLPPIGVALQEPIIDERIYFDSATQVTQIGQGELPTLAWNSATPARHVSVIQSDTADHVL